MHPKLHFLASSLIAAALFPIYKWNVSAIFIGGFLIDIDHILYYYQKTGDLNIFNAYEYHKKFGEILGSYKGPPEFFIFHNVELLLIFGVLAFFSSYLFLIFIGLLTHYLLDMFFDYSRTKRVMKYYSISLFFLKNRNKKFKY